MKIKKLKNQITLVRLNIRLKIDELRLRLCLWIKPKTDCHSCCLTCRHFNDCRWEVEHSEQ